MFKCSGASLKMSSGFMLTNAKNKDSDFGHSLGSLVACNSFLSPSQVTNMYCELGRVLYSIIGDIIVIHYDYSIASDNI